MSCFVLPPSASVPAPLPPEGHEPVAPGGVLLVPASTWRFEEDIEPLLTAIQAAPWAPLVFVEDAPEMPRGLGRDAAYLFGQAADLVRVAPPHRATRVRMPEVAAPTDHPTETSAWVVGNDEALMHVEVVVGAVWNAVRARAAPTVNAIGRLVALRCGTELGKELARALTVRSRWASISKRLAEADLPSVRTWQAAVKVVEAASYASRNG